MHPATYTTCFPCMVRLMSAHKFQVVSSSFLFGCFFFLRSASFLPFTFLGTVMRRRNRLLMCGKTNTPNWLNMAKVKIEVECHEHKCIWRAKKKERKKTMPQSRISNILQTMSDKKNMCKNKLMQYYTNSPDGCSRRKES